VTESLYVSSLFYVSRSAVSSPIRGTTSSKYGPMGRDGIVKFCIHIDVIRGFEMTIGVCWGLAGRPNRNTTVGGWWPRRIVMLYSPCPQRTFCIPILEIALS
jgi:hypothetical protein